MNAAIAIAPDAEFPERTYGRRKMIGALIVTLLAVLAISAFSGGRSHASACGGSPLLVAEFTLPDMTEPV